MNIIIRIIIYVFCIAALVYIIGYIYRWWLGAYEFFKRKSYGGFVYFLFWALLFTATVAGFVYKYISHITE